MDIDNTTYNSTTPQSQAEVLRHRRRYMSPTRTKPRSPRCQYIFRGRANVFPSSPGIPFSLSSFFITNRVIHSASVVSSPAMPILIPSPSTSAVEPIFNMSPVHMHYLPPLKIREPINVMTLRNSGGYRHEYTNSSKPKPRGQSTAVVPLLYTFPRPTSRPKPNSNTSLKDLTLKRPFGLVPQNHHDRLQDATANSLECPSPGQHEDVREDDAHSPPPPNLFLDVSLSPPPPAFPLLMTQKPQPKHIRIIQNSGVHHTGDGRTSSIPKKRLRVPTPAPSPKSRNPLKPYVPDSPSTISSSIPTTPTPLRRIPSHPIPIPRHKPREEDTGVFEDVSLSSLGGGDDEEASCVMRLRDDNVDNVEDEHDGAIDIHPQPNHLQLTFPLLLDGPSNLTPGSPVRLYSQLDGEYQGSRSRSSSLSPKLGLDFTLEQKRDAFISPSPLKFPSSPRDESNQCSLRNTVTKVRNRNREMVEVEYFDNHTDDQTLPPLAQTFEPTSNYYDLSSDSEPVFPAFSPITCNVAFGERAYSALDGLTDDLTPKKNPWLKVTTKFNNPSSSNSTSDSDSNYTFPHSEKRHYKNGRANLNVFNPPALPSFGGSDSGSGEESNSYSEHSSTPSSGSGSDSDSGSQPFLSFPIPIFLPGDPYAVTQVDVTRVPVPSSPMAEEEASFRSSVYGGCVDDSTELSKKAASLSSSRRDTPTPTQTARNKFIPESTQTSNHPSAPVLRRGSEKGRGRKRENGAQGDGTGAGAYGLLKKIIGRHA